jgi:VanZ family protein
MRLPHPLFVLGYGLAMLAVVVLSLMPSPDIPGPEGADKAAHLIAYGTITFLGGLGFRSWDTRILAASTAFGIGMFLEFAQAAWFARSGSIWDAASNGIGAVVGLAAAAIVLQLFIRHVPNPKS